MLIGSWAFTGQARETVKERGKAKGRMNRNASLSKKIIFKAGLKLCETKFSGDFYSPGSLAHKQKQNEITKELSWSENRLQGAEKTEGKIRNTVTWHYQDSETHTAPWRKGVPENYATWRDIRQKPLTEDSHKVNCNNLTK